MDLSTTEKIKRRVVSILPDPTKEVTDCSIVLSNWIQNVDISNIKTRIASFYMNNTAIPCFIGKWALGLPPANWQQVGGTVTTQNNTLTADTLDYAFNFYDSVTTTSHGGILNMDILRSTYGSLKPLVHPSSEYAQLSNKYYWFFDTAMFLDLIIQQINTVINTYAITTGVPYGIQMVKTQNGYGLYVPTTLTNTGYVLQFSKTLIDLFQFKASQSSNSTYLYTLEYNTTPRNFYIENLTTNVFSSQPCSFVQSRYIPDRFFPFDQLLVRTDMPIEVETYYNNGNYTAQNYQNIMLTYKIVNSNPDGIYNFFTSDIDPASGWTSFLGVNTKENIKFDILLRFKTTKDLIPFQIKPDENFTFVIEEIHTL